MNATTTQDGYRDVALTAIAPNPNQPRKHFDDEALDELAASIRQHGLMQPIVIRPMVDGAYQIVAGERRWRAAQRAGRATIAARVMTIDDETTTILAITENVARRDMNEMEEANAYASLTALGKTPAEIADLFGKTVKAIETSLDLLNLVAEIQHLVSTGAVSKNIGVHLSRLEPAQQQATLVRVQAGEFRDNDALIRHVSVMAMVQDQGVGMFGGMFEELDPITEARRATRRSEIERAWAKVEALAAGLGTFMELAPEEIAFAVGHDIQTYAAKMDLLTTAVNRVRNNVRQAAAIAKVALPEA